MAYFPQYPHHDNLPDPEIRAFITNFYHASDRAGADELWISYFTKDADVVIGSDVGHGEDDIRQLRGRMWTGIHNRKHTVTKVFPAVFLHDDDEPKGECEVMMFGHVNETTKDGRIVTVPWAGHGVIRKDGRGEREEWKFARYQVWAQGP